MLKAVLAWTCGDDREPHAVGRSEFCAQVVKREPRMLQVVRGLGAGGLRGSHVCCSCSDFWEGGDEMAPRMLQVVQIYGRGNGESATYAAGGPSLGRDGTRASYVSYRWSEDCAGGAYREPRMLQVVRVPGAGG